MTQVLHYVQVLRYIIVFALSAAFAAPFVSHTGLAQPVNDPLYSEQYYLRDVNIPNVWGFTVGSSSQTIGIVGFGNARSTHIDLQNRVTIGEAAPIPFDFQPQAGTAVAGIAAANTNNFAGIAGVNRNARILSYDASVLSDPPTTDTPGVPVPDIGQFDDELRDVVSDGADLVIAPTAFVDGQPNLTFGVTIPFNNLSVNGGNVSGFFGDIGQSVLSVVRGLNGAGQRWNRATSASLFTVKSGVPLIAPVGDFKESQYVLPASTAQDRIAIAVGSSNKLGASSEFSALGLSSNPQSASVDFVAPGEDMTTTSNTGNQAYFQESGEQYTSTAGSAALVGGIASLLMDYDSSIKPEDLRQILRRTAVDIGDPGFDRKTGFGRVNADAALDYVRNRSFTRGVATNGRARKIRDNTSFTLVRGPWETSLASQKYFGVDLYEITFDINLPCGSDQDMWYRPAGTKGWSAADPNDGTPRANITVTEHNCTAQIKTYTYTGEVYNARGQLVGYNHYPVSPSNAKVAYTVATKPGTPPPPPISASISGASTLDSGQRGTWSAGYSGGSGSVSYRWEYRNPGTYTWRSWGCTGSSCSRTFYNDTNAIQQAAVRVTVTRGSQSDAAQQKISIRTSGDCVLECEGPIESFSASAPSLILEAVDGTALLTWTAPRTGGTDRVLVEHRLAGAPTATWTEIGSVTSEEVSVDGMSRFKTRALDIGNHEFRLGFVKTSGQTRYTEARMVRIQLEEAYQLTTYPNPVRGQATVELATKDAQDVSVEVFNLLGQRVATLHEGAWPAQTTRRLPLDVARANLANGTYFVRVVGEHFAGTTRVTVVR